MQMRRVLLVFSAAMSESAGSLACHPADSDTAADHADLFKVPSPTRRSALIKHGHLVADGILHSIDEASSGFRSTLVNCLGGSFEDVQVDTCHVPLQDGDQLLLCTDGLTDMVSEADIAQMLAATTPAQVNCETLIDAALSNGGRDNVTVVLARYMAAKS